MRETGITYWLMNITKLWKDFPNERACLDELVKLRNLSCKCGSKLYKIKSRHSYACKKGHHTNPLKGTIFENTKVSLRLWFYAIFVISSTRSGVSAKTLQRELGVSYPTAFRMFHKIRELMDDRNESKLFGTVEADETFVGGKAKNRAQAFYSKNLYDKEIIIGMVERQGRVRLYHTPDNNQHTVLNLIGKNVHLDAKVYTDEGFGFHLLKRQGYYHKVINHSEHFRVGDVYTQNIENVWSHLKRGLTGVYRQVSPKYLQAYANEFAFRYNNRHEPEKMFEKMLGRVAKN